MQRRPSRSPRKQSKRPPSPSKPQSCSPCGLSLTLHLQRSLYRKYSSSQNHYYLTHFNCLQDKLQLSTSTADDEAEEYLVRYHRNGSRGVVWARIKQNGKINKEMPRMFHSQFGNVLEKCHHRKRLLEYFKIARGMGLRVQSVDFSSFLLSLHLPQDVGGQFEKLLQESWAQG